MMKEASYLGQLRHHLWLAEGRRDAFAYALECPNDFNWLKSKIHEVETILDDPELVAGPMAPRAGPRTYREGYLISLHDALHLLRQQTDSTDDQGIKEP